MKSIKDINDINDMTFTLIRHMINPEVQQYLSQLCNDTIDFEKRDEMLIQHMKQFTHTPFGMLDIIGLVEFEDEKLILKNREGFVIHTFDEYDPTYIHVLKHYKQYFNVKRLPLTVFTASFLDDVADSLTDDAEPSKRPEIERRIELHNQANQNDMLRQMFDNEMLLLVRVEEYIRKNDLEGLVDKDELLHLIHEYSYDYSYEDSMMDLIAKAIPDVELRLDNKKT